MTIDGFSTAIVLSELVALALIWRLWRSDDHLFFKLTLTLIALIPFIGPVLVFWLNNFPKSQPEIFQDRLRYSTDVFERWRHVIEEKNPYAKFRKWRELTGGRDRP